MRVWNDARGAYGFFTPREESAPVHRVPVFTIVALALLMMSTDSTIVAALRSFAARVANVDRLGGMDH
jgi:hypothetical protein